MNVQGKSDRKARQIQILQIVFFTFLFVFISVLIRFITLFQLPLIKDRVLLIVLVLAGSGMMTAIIFLRRIFIRQTRDLATSTDHLLQMERIGGFSHWEFHPAERRFLLCQNTYEMLDFPLGSLEDIDIFVSHIHPDDRDVLRTFFSDLKPNLSPLEFKIINPSGEVIWIELFSEMQDPQDGKDALRQGVMRDITTFRVREETLQTLMTKTETALRLADMFEWELDLETRRIVIMEPYGSKLFLQPGKQTFNLEEFFSRVDQQNRENMLNQMTSNDSADDASLELETRFNRIDGEVFYLRFFGTHVRNSQGWIIRRYGIAQDISTLREMERALEQSEREKNLVIENINLGLALWTPERRLIWSNRMLFELFGVQDSSMSRDELCYRMLSCEQKACDDCPITEALKQRLPVSQEIDVNNRQLSVTAVPCADQYGEIVRMITLVRDVSGEKALQKQLVQAQKMDAVGHLAAGIAQDFNNLLHVILNYAESAKETANSQTVTSLDPIIEAAQKGHELVNLLLSFSEQDTKFYPRLISLVEWLPSFINRLSTRLDEKVSIDLYIDPVISDISADPYQLTLMMENLILNACEAMQNCGSVIIRVSEEAYSDPEYLKEQSLQPAKYCRVSVKDNGKGIPEADLNQVFNPFFSTKEFGNGSGLGLSTVYALMKKHKGHVSIESKENEGSIFSLYFPVRSEMDVDTNELMSTIRESIGENDINILLVDDDPTVRKITCHTLEKAGYKVIQAADGQTAIEIFSSLSNVIQLVLLDVVLPRRSGREVYEFILERYPDMRVIFATGYASTYLDDLPPDAIVIQKPYAKRALLRAVKQAFIQKK